MNTDPGRIGRLVTERFLQSPHLLYDGTIHYAEVITWYGALRFANRTKNTQALRRLAERFEPLFVAKNAGGEAHLLPRKDHVDFNMFGTLPLELFALTGDDRYKTLGLSYADTQWSLPPHARSEECAFARDGYTWQTRFWMDDMYMISALQLQAFRITADRSYLDRTASEMVLYLRRLQNPDGLFYHAPDAPFCWGRANGWMAWAMSDILASLSADHPQKESILEAYQKMMASLLHFQGRSGLWKQLLDRADSWDETSCTAMFIYALHQGVKNGYLRSEAAFEAIDRGWAALCERVTTDGDIRDVCAGTATGTEDAHYLTRPRITGDYHGQAPLLWCAVSLLDKPNRIKGISKNSVSF